MRKLTIPPLYFIICSMLFCCSPAKEEEHNTETIQKDTTQFIQSLIYGLWSMDSGNILKNEGFLFHSDGTVDLVSSEMSGKWELKGNDSIRLEINSWSGSNTSVLSIDSLNQDRMVLSDSDGIHLYKKVPFGINNEGNVIQGFSGYLASGQMKEYSVNLPPTKKIALKMACPDSSVTFRLYDDKEAEITSTAVRNWSGILIRSGKYRLVLSKPKVSQWKEEADYDIKIVAY